MHITETKALREVPMLESETVEELDAKCAEFDGTILPLMTGGKGILHFRKGGVDGRKAICGFRSPEAAAKFDEWRASLPQNVRCAPTGAIERRNK